MRKLLLTVAGAAALATGSMASAAVTVTASSGLTATQDPFLNSSLVTNNPDGSSNIAFGIQPVPIPSFAGSFDFTNTIAGVYNIVLQTSTTGVSFTSAALSGGGCTPAICTLGGTGSLLTLNGLILAANTNYTFSFAGNNDRTTTSGTLNGNLSIDPAVPEPATWAMMLLGFGGIGLAMRRRRRPALAQLA